MTSLARHSGPWATFALSTVVLALGGCGRVPGQFEILNDQVPQPGCVIGTDQMIYQGEGVMDISLVQTGARSGYVVFPLMKNNLPAAVTGEIDTNLIVLSSFAVDISLIGSAPPQTAALFAALESGNDPTDGRNLLHFREPWSGSIQSGGGLLPAGVDAFPVELAHRISATGEIGLSPSLMANLKIRAFGKTATQDMESDPFDFPISICSGCLVANVQACPYASKPTNTGNVCNVAQDDPVDCCTLNGSLICPPVVVGQ
jgi:hypothetical protein